MRLKDGEFHEMPRGMAECERCGHEARYSIKVSDRSGVRYYCALHAREELARAVR